MRGNDGKNDQGPAEMVSCAHSSRLDPATAVAPRACQFPQPAVLGKRCRCLLYRHQAHHREVCRDCSWSRAISETRFRKYSRCAPVSPPAEPVVVRGKAFMARFLRRAAALGISVSPATLSTVRGREAHEDLIACDILVAGLCLVPGTRKGHDGPAGEPRSGAGRTE